MASLTDGSSYQAWLWERLIAQLDAAGYVLVKKPDPVLLKMGVPKLGK